MKFELNPRAVLSLLRGFCTLGLIASTSRADIDIGAMNVAEVSASATELMHAELSRYLTGALLLQSQSSQLQTDPTRGFYGLADALSYSLSNSTKLVSPSNKRPMQLLITLIQNSLVEHPEHSVFAENTTQDILAGQTIPHFEKCKGGPLMGYLSSASHWHFWREWYQGFLDGKPLDWELQRRVALIDDKDWEQGPEHIAELIEKIRDDYAKEQAATEARAPEHEPNNVEQLFKHPRSVSANLSLSSQAVIGGFEAFRQESGLNETPEFLLPLEAMPANLTRIRSILQTKQHSAESANDLKQEIGRLNAKVALLEQQLATLKTDLEQQKKPWFGKLALLGSAIASVSVAVWTVSGDELGPQQRAENLTEYWEYFFPPENPPTMTTKPNTLPPTTDT